MFSIFNDLYLLLGGAVAALLLGTYGLISRFGIALLVGLTRGAGTTLGVKVTGSAAQLESRRIASNPALRHARQALIHADARRARMAFYSEAWLNLIAERAGPFALSMHLYSVLHSDFHDKVARLRRRFREFDRLEDRAQAIVQRYEHDYERRCEPLRDQVIAAEVEMSRSKARGQRFAGLFWKRRWRLHKRRQIDLRWRIMTLRRNLDRIERRLDTAYRPVLQPALTELDRYERNYLAQWVHSFEADLESFRLTIVSGRLIDMLALPEYRASLRTLGLAALPTERAQLMAHLTRAIQDAGAGFGPNDSLESLFEVYLRLRLLDDADLLLRWGVDRVWLERLLPAPGATGIAHERFLHLGTVDTWRSPAGRDRHRLD